MLGREERVNQNRSCGHVSVSTVSAAVLMHSARWKYVLFSVGAKRSAFSASHGLIQFAFGGGFGSVLFSYFLFVRINFTINFSEQSFCYSCIETYFLSFCLAIIK